MTELSRCPRMTMIGVVMVMLLPACLSIPEVSSNSECEKPLQPGHICCGGYTHEEDRDRVCCRLKNTPLGERAYVWRKRCEEGHTDNALEQCGDHFYDVRYEGCCGNIPFNLRKFKCCSGSHTSSPVAVNAICCNGQALRQGQLCCQTSFGKVLINKTSHAHTSCCVPSDLSDPRTQRHRISTYSKDTHYCNQEKGQAVQTPYLSSESFAPSESSSPLSSQLAENQQQSSAKTTMKPTPTTRPTKDSDKIHLISQLLNWSKACLRGGEGEEIEGGDELKCCGRKPFKPSAQTCCNGKIHELPSSDSVCCVDQAFPQEDRNNPCLAYCNGKLFNTDTHMCCKKHLHKAQTDRDRCCGSSPINPDTHSCCNDMPLPRGNMSCCAQTTPCYDDIMSCDAETGSVTLRQNRLKTDKVSHRLCSRTLHTWGEHWIPMIDTNMVKIQGRVERCGIRLKKRTLIIPLKPAMAVVGGERVSSCVSEGGVKLLVKLPRGAGCPQVREVYEDYLKDKTVELFVKPHKIRRCHSKGGVIVRLKEKDRAFILLSRKLDAILQDAFRPAGR